MASCQLMNMCFRRCFRSYFKPDYDSVASVPKAVAPLGAPDWEDASGPDDKISNALPVEQLAAHVQKLHADSDLGFSREYEEIQKYCRDHRVVAAHEHCSHPDNKCKNRYLNIVACKYADVM